MKIDEINKRINELETSVALLSQIKREFLENERDESLLNALTDGIRYTKMRLDDYRTADWIMDFDIEKEIEDENYINELENDESNI